MQLGTGVVFSCSLRSCSILFHHICKPGFHIVIRPYLAWAVPGHCSLTWLSLDRWKCWNWLDTDLPYPKMGIWYLPKWPMISSSCSLVAASYGLWPLYHVWGCRRRSLRFWVHMERVCRRLPSMFPQQWLCRACPYWANVLCWIMCVLQGKEVWKNVALLCPVLRTSNWPSTLWWIPTSSIVRRPSCRSVSVSWWHLETQRSSKNSGGWRVLLEVLGLSDWV